MLLLIKLGAPDQGHSPSQWSKYLKTLSKIKSAKPYTCISCKLALNLLLKIVKRYFSIQLI